MWVASIGRHAAEFLILICLVAQFFCGMASVTANSRMIYAFSRDGAVPGSRFWHKVNKRTRTPTNSIWFAVVGAFILGLPSLYQNKGYSVAFFAIVSVAVVGLYVSYVIPVLLRRMRGSDFTPGPWQLGKWSPIIGWTAVVWVVIICFPLMLPQFHPAGLNSWNFAPVAVARRHRIRRHLLAGLGPQLVHRPEGAGHGRGARGDRGGTLVARVVRARLG